MTVIFWNFRAPPVATAMPRFRRAAFVKSGVWLIHLAMLRSCCLLPAALCWLVLSSGARGATPPFAEAGVTFLEKHCVACHGKEKQKGGLTLNQFRDDFSVLRARRTWKEILNMVESGEMPPEDREPPTAEERKGFVAAATAVFARAENAKPDPGRLTVRRLNRTEYNHTIRDLLHVEFRPADDFPSDEVGHGFDNISDVLSVSPLLMERYLDAAERVAELAIPLNAASPPKRTLRAMYCEPASPDTPKDIFRPVNPALKEAVLSGPLNTPVRIAPDADYIMRARLYAKAAGGKPVRVALLIYGPQIERPSSAAEMAKLDGVAVRAVTPGRILKIVEVTAREEKSAQIIEVKIPRTKGVERIALAALKPEGGPPPMLFVEWVECEGPMDPRTPATKALMVFTPGKPQREQAREVLWRFASRAWRRPVEREELDRLVALVDYAIAHNDSWEEALRRAVGAVLASPKFVFRLEPDDAPGNPEPHPLNDYQLATRLSYFLWSSCPDEELLQLAYEQKLAANLEAQVRRMVDDPRADALVENFAIQWLQLGRLATHSADPKTFPNWRPELRTAMLEETRRFVREIVEDDHSILDLLDGAFTWVNRPLAELYGLSAGIKDGEWKRVSLAGTPRGGLLTQASVLTVTSNPTRTSPVKRGKWVLEQLLGTPPAPAPPNVPSLDDRSRKELTGTFRQKLEQHRANPNCAGCHTKMDSFGLALENFNGIGQWRDREESGAPVDASASLGSRKFNGAADLKALLRERRKDFARCFTEKLMIYALGRGLDYYDDPSVDRVQRALAAKDYRFSVLLTEIVKSDAFRLRRGATQMPTETAQK